MIKRKIVLEDGRYLIYFSFEEQEAVEPEQVSDVSALKCRNIGCVEKCCGGKK